MENSGFSKVEEGGIATMVDMQSDIVEMILMNPKLQCPECGEIVILNGRCKTCPECGWSSCDI
jgi:hypothetical protein